MENLGNWNPRSYALLDQPGTITVPPADYDGDGQIDIAALVSQDSEAVHLFRNLGGGEFRDLVLWRSKDESWGSSGLDVADMNRDGLPDLIYSNGDGFDVGVTKPAVWHTGCSGSKIAVTETFFIIASGTCPAATARLPRT